MSCDTPISANLAAIYEIIKIVRAVCPEGSESDENTFDPSKVKESVRIAACLKILNYPSTHEKVKEVGRRLKLLVYPDKNRELVGCDAVKSRVAWRWVTEALEMTNKSSPLNRLWELLLTKHELCAERDAMRAQAQAMANRIASFVSRSSSKNTVPVSKELSTPPTLPVLSARSSESTEPTGCASVRNSGAEFQSGSRFSRVSESTKPARVSNSSKNDDRSPNVPLQPPLPSPGACQEMNDFLQPLSRRPAPFVGAGTRPTNDATIDLTDSSPTAGSSSTAAKSKVARMEIDDFCPPSFFRPPPAAAAAGVTLCASAPPPPRAALKTSDLTPAAGAATPAAREATIKKHPLSTSKSVGGKAGTGVPTPWPLRVSGNATAAMPPQLSKATPAAGGAVPTNVPLPHGAVSRAGDDDTRAATAPVRRYIGPQPTAVLRSRASQSAGAASSNPKKVIGSESDSKNGYKSKEMNMKSNSFAIDVVPLPSDAANTKTETSKKSTVQGKNRTNGRELRMLQESMTFSSPPVQSKPNSSAPPYSPTSNSTKVASVKKRKRTSNASERLSPGGYRPKKNGVGYEHVLPGVPHSKPGVSHKKGANSNRKSNRESESPNGKQPNDTGDVSVSATDEPAKKRAKKSEKPSTGNDKTVDVTEIARSRRSSRVYYGDDTDLNLAIRESLILTQRSLSMDDESKSKSESTTAAAIKAPTPPSSRSSTPFLEIDEDDVVTPPRAGLSYEGYLAAVQSRRESGVNLTRVMSRHFYDIDISRANPQELDMIKKYWNPPARLSLIQTRRKELRATLSS